MKKTKSKKCCMCGKELKEEKQQFIYFDSSNIAITKSMENKIFCKDCYLERFGVK